MSTEKDMSVLYIPDFVFPTDGELIKKRFNEEGYGIIKEVELVKQWECELNVDKDDLYSAAYVTVEEWFDNEKTREFQKNLLDNDTEVRLTHGEDDYWEFEIPIFQEDSCGTSCQDNESEEDPNQRSQNVDEIECLKNRLSKLENMSGVYTNNVNYLLFENRKNMIKKERKEKMLKLMKQRYKCQREWKNRLRPKNKLNKVDRYPS